jgi:hypothetical protein
LSRWLTRDPPGSDPSPERVLLATGLSVLAVIGFPALFFYVAFWVVDPRLWLAGSAIAIVAPGAISIGVATAFGSAGTRLSPLVLGARSSG